MSKLELSELHIDKTLDKDGEVWIGMVAGNCYDSEMFLRKSDAVLLIAHLQHVFALPVPVMEKVVYDSHCDRCSGDWK